MARRIEVQLIGDSRSLERSFAKANRSGRDFNRNMGVASRTSSRVSSGFRSLGAAAGITGGILGAAGLVGAVRSAWQEMNEASKVSAQTSAVLKSTGGSANVTAKQVDALAGSLLRKSGVDDEVIKSGENMLLTFTGIRNEVGKGNDIFTQSSKAILDMDTAMTHGKVTQESLSKTAILVGKALQDPVKGSTALRRVGVALTKQQQAQIKAFVASGDTMSAQKLILAELNREFGGSAAAIGGTLPGKINILRETVRNLSAQMLTQLIPAVTRIVSRLQVWLSNTRNQQRVMQTFRNIVANVTGVLHALRSAFSGLNAITGSAKNSLKLLIGAFVAFKALSLAASARGVAASLGLVSKKAAAATLKVRLLRGSLLGLQGLVIVVGIEFLIHRKGLNDYLNKIVPGRKRFQGFLEDHVPGYRKLDKALGVELQRGPNEKIANEQARRVNPGRGVATATAIQIAARNKLDQRHAAAIIKAAPKVGLTAEQRNQFFDNALGRTLGRVQDIRSDDGQIRALQAAAAQIQARINATKDVTRRLSLEDKLLDVQRDIRGAREHKAQAAQQARQDAAEKRRQQAEARQQALLSRQFRQLGFDSSGDERTPTKRNLQKRLGRLSDSVKGTVLDTGKTRGLLARVRRVLSESIVPKDIRARVREMLDGVTDELKNHQAKNQTLFRHANSNSVLAGLGLSPEQLRAARSRIAQLGAGNTLPGAHTAAFAGAGALTVHTSVNLDGRTVAKNTTEHQRKADSRRSSSRRGPYAGRH